MILEAINIEKSFGKKKVLKGINLAIERGNLYGITGENGVGKSTLLKIITGWWRADKGKVNILGKIGYCPQNALLFNQLTVFENFKYFAKAYNLKDDWVDTSKQLLKQFSLENYVNYKVESLSGGSQQKLNLSIALLNKPDILILDEPYNGFDWETYLKFWEISTALVKTGCTILIVTHFINDIQRFKKIFKLKNGVIE